MTYSMSDDLRAARAEVARLTGELSFANSLVRQLIIEVEELRARD